MSGRLLGVTSQGSSTSQEGGLAPAVGGERGQAPLPDLFYFEGRSFQLTSLPRVT